MSSQIQVQSDALFAVRRFLQVAVAGRDTQEAMDTLVAETSRLPLANLETWERALRTELLMVERTRPAASWKMWQILKKPTRVASWLDLCSGNGFKREHTLRSLSDGAPNSFFFSLAVRRLNDWVPQVRAAAREHLYLIARRSDPEHIVDALWNTLPHSISWGRMEDLDRQILVDLASNERVASILKLRIISATAGPATAVLSQIGRTPALDRWLAEIAKGAIQPSVRAKAYRAQLERRMVWLAGRKWKWTDLKWCQGRFEPILGERNITVKIPFVTLLKMAAVDRSPIVRRVAGELLIHQLGTVGDESAGLAELLASDASPSVAEQGRFALSQLGRI